MNIIAALFQRRPETGIDDDRVAATGLERGDARSLIAQLQYRDPIPAGIESPVFQSEQDRMIGRRAGLRCADPFAFEILRFPD